MGWADNSRPGLSVSTLSGKIRVELLNREHAVEAHGSAPRLEGHDSMGCQVGAGVECVIPDFTHLDHRLNRGAGVLPVHQSRRRGNGARRLCDTRRSTGSALRAHRRGPRPAEQVVLEVAAQRILVVALAHACIPMVLIGHDDQIVRHVRRGSSLRQLDRSGNVGSRRSSRRSSRSPLMSLSCQMDDAYA